MASQHGCLFIPHRDGCVLICGVRHDISPKQSDLLQLLYDHKGKLVTREMIASRWWGGEPRPKNWQSTIRVQMTHIRAALPAGYIDTEYDAHWSTRYMKWAIGGGTECKGWRLVGDLHIELFIKEE